MEDFIKTHPGAGFNQAIYGTSPEGMKGQYGVTPVPGFKTNAGAEAPGLLTGGQLTPPPGMYFGTYGPNNPQPVGQSAQPATTRGEPSPPIATQTQGGLSPMDQAGVNYEEAKAAATAKGQEEGGKAATITGMTDQVDRSINLIDELTNDKEGMQWGTGYMANLGLGNIKGTHTYGWTKGVEQLKNQLTLDLLPTMQRGRMSPALFDMLQNATAGQELDTGNPDFAKNLQNTRDALVQIKAAMQKGANVPVTGAPAAPQANIPSGAIKMLQKDPKLRTQFEAKYGAGSAASILGQ